MHGLAFALLGLGFVPEPIELSRDVVVVEARQFDFPVEINPEFKGKIKCVRLFASEDKGKTWKHKKDCKPTDKHISFTAPRDGLYYFALQVVFKDGTGKPEDVADLTPGMKVYVNRERKPVKDPKSYEELEREVAELRKTVKQLQKRVKALEGDRKPK
jgi:hypothetical protein